MKKRGQVTLFVILGLVLIILIALTLFIVSNSKQGFEEPKITQLPEDFYPVRDHVDQCLEITLIDALKQIGMRGGYINPNDEELSKKEMREDLNKYKNTELIRFNKNDENSTIPLWFYLGNSNNCNNCVLKSLAPSKEELEEQIETYILSHLQDCINYGNIRNIVVQPDEKQEIDVKLFNESIAVTYNRKLILKIGDRTQKIDTFFINPDMPFLKMYYSALEITSQEFATNFLENYMMYLISAYSGLDSQLPPIAAHTEGFDYKIWALPSVENTWKTILRTYTPVLRVKDSKNDVAVESSDDPYLSGFLNITRVELFNQTTGSELGLKDYKIDFIYPGSSFLDINPRQGMLLKPRIEKTSGMLFLPPKQDNYYNFFYDVSAPFIVVIQKENFTPGNNMEFIFAVEGNLMNNKNLQELFMGRGIIPWSYNNLRLSVDDPTEGVDVLAECASIEDETIKKACLEGDYSEEENHVNQYNRNESVPSIFCKEEAKIVPVKIQTFEAVSNNPLEGVSITYKCGYYGSCNIGVSRNDSNNVYTGYYGNLSSCQGGLLKFEKQGYNTKTFEFSTIGNNVKQELNVYLEKVYEKEINLSLLDLSKNEESQSYYDDYSLSSPRELKDNEQAIITLTRTSSDAPGVFEAPFSSTVIIDNETKNPKVRLIPGLYEVMVTYLDNNGVFIPKGCQKVHGKKIPEEDIEIKPAPWGGLELNKGTSLFQVQRNDLEKDNQLIMPTFRFPNPKCLNDLEEMGNIQKFVRMFREEATPKFK